MNISIVARSGAADWIELVGHPVLVDDRVALLHHVLLGGQLGPVFVGGQRQGAGKIVVQRFGVVGQHLRDDFRALRVNLCAGLVRGPILGVDRRIAHRRAGEAQSGRAQHRDRRSTAARRTPARPIPAAALRCAAACRRRFGAPNPTAAKAIPPPIRCRAGAPGRAAAAPTARWVRRSRRITAMPKRARPTLQPVIVGSSKRFTNISRMMTPMTEMHSHHQTPRVGTVDRPTPSSSLPQYPAGRRQRMRRREDAMAPRHSARAPGRPWPVALSTTTVTSSPGRAWKSCIALRRVPFSPAGGSRFRFASDRWPP